jgi:type IV secretory pathway TrbF-like protein
MIRPTSSNAVDHGKEPVVQPAVTVRSGFLLGVAVNHTIVPWVVQVDRFGAAQAVAPAIADYRPADPQIAWRLARRLLSLRAQRSNIKHCKILDEF